jgi:hypothetical protein
MSDEIRNFGPGELYIAPPPPAAVPPLDAFAAMAGKPIITAEQAHLLSQSFAELARSARESLAQMGPLLDWLREPGAEESIEERKAKALRLRQTRNTGPRRPGPQDSPRHRRTDR